MISDFQLFGDSGPGFEFSKKLNLNTYRGGMISALDPDPGSAFGPFDDSGYEFIKNWNLQKNVCNYNKMSECSYKRQGRDEARTGAWV